MEPLKTFQYIEKFLTSYLANSHEVTIDKKLQGKICFYPGTFNPWHEGHGICVELHLQSFKDVPLMILPDHNPQKELALHAPYEIPLNVQSNNLYLSYLFKNSQKKNPTHSWIRYLKTFCPDLKLGLLMGLDSFMTLTTWIRFEELLCDLSFMEVVPRKINDLANNLPDKVSEIDASLKIITPLLEIHHLKNHPFETISSTQIRQKRMQKS